MHFGTIETPQIPRAPTETTAHTLAGTIGFLAVNEDLQEEIYQQIVEVVGHERDPVSGSPSHILPLYQYSRIGACGLRQARQSSLRLSRGPAIIPYEFS